jgi:hypothetical protein
LPKQFLYQKDGKGLLYTLYAAYHTTWTWIYTGNTFKTRDPSGRAMCWPMSQRRTKPTWTWPWRLPGRRSSMARGPACQAM